MTQKTLERIDVLTEKQARFILKAMLMAGHVSESIIDKSIDLAETIKEC